jgi:hypothetical protein
VVNVASIAHVTGKIDMARLREPAQGGAKAYSGYANYANSKLAQLLHAADLSARERERAADGAAGPSVEAFAVHPGVIATGLGKDAACCSFTKLLYACPCLPCTPSFISIEQGAATGVRCCVDPDLSEDSGGYFSGCRARPPMARAAQDKQLQLELRVQSLAWCEHIVTLASSEQELSR